MAITETFPKRFFIVAGLLILAALQTTGAHAQQFAAAKAAAENPLVDLGGQWRGGIFNSEKWNAIIYPAI